MDKNDALKRWLGKAWELGVGMAEIAYLAEDGATHVRDEAYRLLGASEPVSAVVDSFLPSAPGGHIQPKPR